MEGASGYVSNHVISNHINGGGGVVGGGVENEYMKEEIHQEGLRKGRQRLDSPTSIATHIYSTNIGKKRESPQWTTTVSVVLVADTLLCERIRQSVGSFIGLWVHRSVGP